MQIVFSYLFGIIMLVIWLILVPILLGLPFGGLGGEDRKHVRTAWICGFIEMWAVFQLVSIIFIMTTGKFSHIVYTYIGVITVFCCLGFGLSFNKLGSFRINKEAILGQEKVTRLVNIIIWIGFAAVLVFQIYKSITMAFADGDDAYYIPISASAVAGNELYTVIPYDGYHTTMDMRHALAPFPIWIAFLSRISGIHSTVLAHTILGSVLILVCYSIYYRIAYMLFRNNRNGIPVFMLLVSVLVMFSNYSFYTVETFLITRTTQGKAVLGNIIVPFIMLCLLQMGQEFTFDENLANEHRRPNRESNKRKVLLGILITTATIASWLCSTMGAILCVALIGISGLIITVTYKNIKALVYALACCLPSIFFLLFYLVVS